MDKAWEEIVGNRPLLLVASHNFPHLRKRKVKPRDIGTGSIVKQICRKWQLWGLISTSVQPDPNWYQRSLFRKRVKTLIKAAGIKVVLDIHGRREKYPVLLEFLPNGAFEKSYTNLLAGLDLKDFDDKNQLTLTEDLGNKNFPALEIEIRKDGGVPGINQANYLAAQGALDKLVRNLLTTAVSLL